MTVQNVINLGRMTAIISFLIGTGIFALFYATYDIKVAFVGLYYVIIATLINLPILIFVAIRAYRNLGNHNELWATVGLILLNIPIAALYAWLFFISI